MPVDYQVVPNALTSPPSFTGRVRPKAILDIHAIAREINIHNPSITEEISMTVIKAFRDEVLYQLSEGNTVNIASFCSFASSLPFRVAAATDPLPKNVIDVRAKPSTPFKNALRQIAKFSRLPYTEKAPNASEFVDTNSGLSGWIRDNNGFRINGSDIGFDSSDAALGVTVVLADGTEEKQSSIGLNDPSSVIIVPSFESSLPDTEHVEITILLKNRYTDNGQVRTGSIANKVRATNESAGFFSVGMEDSPVTLTTYTGSNVTARIISSIKPDGTLTLSAGAIDGVMGQVYDVLPATASVDVEFDGNTATLTIDDYASLYANVLSYQRYMQEVAPLSAA